MPVGAGRDLFLICVPPRAGCVIWCNRRARRLSCLVASVSPPCAGDFRESPPEAVSRGVISGKCKRSAFRALQGKRSRRCDILNAAFGVDASSLNNPLRTRHFGTCLDPRVTNFGTAKVALNRNWRLLMGAKHALSVDNCAVANIFIQNQLDEHVEIKFDKNELGKVKIDLLPYIETL